MAAITNSEDLSVERSVTGPKDLTPLEGGWCESARLTVRVASLPDIKSLVQLCGDAHSESVFADIPFSEKKVLELCDKATDKAYPNHIALIAETKGKPIGFLYAVAGEYYAGSEVLLTTVHTLYVSRHARSSLLGGKAAFRLVRGVKLWSEKIQAKHILFHVTSGIAPGSTDRFMRKMGFSTLGGNYVE